VESDGSIRPNQQEHLEQCSSIRITRIT